jgi:hypothetical protein
MKEWQGLKSKDPQILNLNKKVRRVARQEAATMYGIWQHANRSELNLTELQNNENENSTTYTS